MSSDDLEFHATPIPGLVRIRLALIHDERGFFARSWCRDTFARHGIPAAFVQHNISYNARQGTLRGMHYQSPPHAEGKLLRVVRGRLHDVVLDLREDSPSLRQWYSVELTAENFELLFIPPGCAHGYLTLADDTELHYQMTAAYQAAAARGIRWDDPCLRGAWPGEPCVISDRDRNLPFYTS